ncbi:protein turtle homolog A-like isoform X2 [Limulus polyphemus]|uniref:Protein turtle homolog A-like isoform X2 n=1 Tax=Limulus polyphemus TaxID=6850 RepID=A0ABM1T3B9_LIMPO|nr:protein turtle homolog A-like isoform X2 [Limulus polyphemus]
MSGVKVLRIYMWSFLISFVLSKASIRILQPLPPVTEGDLGSRLTLNCNISGHPVPHFSWYKDGHELAKNLTLKVESNDGRLYSSGLRLGDAGSYTCVADNHYKLQQLTPPGLLMNVTVVPSMVVATVRWHVADDGGYPILYFTLLYMPVSHPVNGTREFPLSIKVSPIVRKFLVYHLKPGTQYIFQIWASNKLGPGRPTSVKVTTARPLDTPDVVEKMIAQDGYFSSTLWMVAAYMVAASFIFLSCFTCVLIYRSRKHVFVEDGLKAVPNVIANPGFDFDLEEAYLLREADQNGNTEQIVRTNNNSIIQPESG